MKKLAQIGDDIFLGARASFDFWKHVMQLLCELFTFGYIQFDEERQQISEQSLKDLHGRYLKFKLKSTAVEAPLPEVPLTPIGNTLIGQFEDIENSSQFRAELAQLNEVWYVFVGLALVMALLAFFIHRKLQQGESLKVDFRAQASPVQKSEEHKPSTSRPSDYQDDEEHYFCDDEQQAMGVGSKSRHADKYVDIEQLSASACLYSKVDKRQSTKENSFEQAMQASRENAAAQQQSSKKLPPREIIIKQDLEKIDEQEEEFVIADFSQVPETRSILNEQFRMKN